MSRWPMRMASLARIAWRSRVSCQSAMPRHVRGRHRARHRPRLRSAHAVCAARCAEFASRSVPTRSRNHARRCAATQPPAPRAQRWTETLVALLVATECRANRWHRPDDAAARHRGRPPSGRRGTARAGYRPADRATPTKPGRATRCTPPRLHRAMRPQRDRAAPPASATIHAASRPAARRRTPSQRSRAAAPTPRCDRTPRRAMRHPHRAESNPAGGR